MAKKKEIVPMKFEAGVMPSLHNLILKDDKKGMFKRSSVNIGIPTGFLPLDYRNGYKMKVYDDNDNVIHEYNNIGVFCGSFNTIIGKTGTAKTTLAVQMAANLSRYTNRKYGKYAEIYHFDAEQASNYTRIKNITGMTISELDKCFHMTQEVNRIEDIYEMMLKIAMMKETYKEQFTINTGIKNEFNEDVTMYVPTVLIVDSLPSITTADSDEKSKKDGLQTGTNANRVAKAISAFYKQSMAIVKKYNFVVFVINHINKKIEIGGMPTQPQTMYLKMDESVPCGFAPLYYAHNIFKIVSAGKREIEKDGFDGFRARVELLKSRSNKAGKFCHLIYDQEVGFDPCLSMYDYLCEDKKLIEGRNPYRYIKGFENIKFDDRKFREEVHNNQELFNALYATSAAALDEILSRGRMVDTTPSPGDISNIVDSLKESYDSDNSFDDDDKKSA